LSLKNSKQPFKQVQNNIIDELPPSGRPMLKRGGTEKFGIEELPGYSRQQAQKPLNLFSAGSTKRDSSDFIIGGRSSA
jgi:hypothetical protein